MTREQIEQLCPTIDLYGKSPKECWVLGYESALKTIEMTAAKPVSEALKNSIPDICRCCKWCSEEVFKAIMLAL